MDLICHVEMTRCLLLVPHTPFLGTGQLEQTRDEVDERRIGERNVPPFFRACLLFLFLFYDSVVVHYDAARDSILML